MRSCILTEDQIKFIEANYLLMSRKDMAKKFGFGVWVLDRYYKRKGLIVPKEISIQFKVVKMIGKTTFSPDDDKYIKEHYLDMAFNQIGKVLGRSDSGIRGRIRSLGLIIPEEIILQRVIDARIKPGNEPFNKGKAQSDYMTEEAIDKTVATRFKKGNQHVSYGKSTGKITFYLGSLYINTGYKKREIYARYQYRKFIGELDTSDIVTFKDENPLNCCPTNLKKITRGENMIRNSGAINLSAGMVATYLATTSRNFDRELRDEILKQPDLIELKRNELLLTRAIKQQEYGSKQ